ncbi:hypothetical protein LDENG_00090010 [Lucifuga dentata]|nr:hypothetical protein LDENG_00090010 [Lucifuga dentata]
MIQSCFWSRFLQIAKEGIFLPVNLPSLMIRKKMKLIRMPSGKRTEEAGILVEGN